MIREWRAEDLDTLAALEAENFGDEAWNRRSLADALISDKFYGFVMEEEGVITAYGGIGVIFEESELQLIATANGYRKCGRAQRIIDVLFEEARKKGAERMFLEVRVSNAPAQLLYLKNGFVGVYTRPRYYPNGEDAVVMKKELI